MIKVVINTRYGGFGLSHDAMMRYAELKGIKLIVKPENFWPPTYYVDEIKDENIFSYYDLDRNDPFLVQVVEELGDRANGEFAHLKVVEIPDDVVWYVSNYDGMEHVAEHHRTWS